GGDDLQNFAGLAARSPFLAAAMSIFLLSLAGLPPLAGFFGKFYLFSATFRAGGNHGLLWLVALALFGSFVSLYYYLIPLKMMFVDKSPASDTGHRSQMPVRLGLTGPFLANATIAVLAGAVLFFGLMPQTLAARIIASLP
ncbi:MAG TPA: proton-conducting transporter membrane subunit, partial [Chthoniobacterales bacterium]